MTTNEDEIEQPEQQETIETPDIFHQEKAIEPDRITPLTGMYQEWFLDYASYVILERAVPHLNDGLKPVQRRILHAMRRMEDGRYNKVANIIGNTMQFHPHGDASIGDALTQLGQKGLLIDTQGNWGNIFTGDSAAAPRYIEARLSKFAMDVVFNPKTTEWKTSYDGRNEEPVTLPLKFPLLLAQGVEGIAVGLASKIMPHNFLELIDASIKHLRNEPFTLYPDFPSGGYIEVSNYKEGLRGGNIKIRAKITKEDNKTLKITEIPFVCTSCSIIESIIKANDKGKIKIKKVDDNTADKVEIMVQLAPGVSPDQAIDALYAFTDCETSISPNSCVIFDDKPQFMSVNDMLKYSAEQTKHLLQTELQIRLNELEEEWHFSSLEKLFFEQRIYRLLEQDTDTWEQVIEAIAHGFAPYHSLLRREITTDDLVKLTEKPVRKISKFDIKKADEHILGIETEIDEVQNNLSYITEYTIRWFEQIAKKYGKDKERKSEIRNFENIEAVQVVVANEKLYVDRAEGFVGTNLKKDEFVCDCSDMDDIIVFLNSGKYIISKVSGKTFVGKNILHVGIWRKNDSRTTYNVIYRDGLSGTSYVKRFQVQNITRDKEYDMTQGKNGTKIYYFSANPNGEAEVVRVLLKPKLKLKKLTFDFDFTSLTIKGRQSQGNILSRNEVHKIILQEKGVSTLGGIKIWFDSTVARINTAGNGTLIGEYRGNDKIIVFYKNGNYITTGFELSNRYDDDVILIEKYKQNKIYTCIYFDAEQQFYYLKRFNAEISGKPIAITGESKDSYIVLLSNHPQATFNITFAGKSQHRAEEIVAAEEFISIKSDKAKGKRLSNFEIGTVTEISEPVIETEQPYITGENDFEEPDKYDTSTQLQLDF